MSETAQELEARLVESAIIFLMHRGGRAPLLALADHLGPLAPLEVVLRAVESAVDHDLWIELGMTAVLCRRGWAALAESAPFLRD